MSQLSHSLSSSPTPAPTTATSSTPLCRSPSQRTCTSYSNANEISSCFHARKQHQNYNLPSAHCHHNNDTNDISTGSELSLCMSPTCVGNDCDMRHISPATVALEADASPTTAMQQQQHDHIQHPYHKPHCPADTTLDKRDLSHISSSSPFTFVVCLSSSEHDHGSPQSTCHHNDEAVDISVVALIGEMSESTEGCNRDGEQVVCSTRRGRASQPDAHTLTIKNNSVSDVDVDSNALNCPPRFASQSTNPDDSQLSPTSSGMNNSSAPLLDHPHIVYPAILTFPDHDCETSTCTLNHPRVSSSSSTTMELIDPALGTQCQNTLHENRSPSVGRRSPKKVESRHDRIHFQEGNGGNGKDCTPEMKGFETERMSQVEPHRPVSMKRRKVCDDDDEENDHNNYDYEDSEARSRYKDHDAPSSSLHGCSDSVDFAASETTPSVTRTSSPRPSNCPLRKRRSILADSFNFSDPKPMGLPTNSNNDIDTSSLSLLSATSAIVSEGGVPALDSESGSSQSIFSPPSSSSPSSPTSSSSSSASSPTEPRSSLFLDSLSYNSMSSDAAKKQPMSALSVCRHLRYCFPLLGACRKRNFEDAIELTRPLGNDHSVEYLGWFGSIKRRKIHHFPTRWTSALSPSPYVKLMAMRDFWEVMRSRLDLSWLDLWAITASRFQSFHQMEDLNESDMVVHDDGSTGSVKETRKDSSGSMCMESAISKETFSPRLPSRIMTLRESSSTATNWCEDGVSGRGWPMSTRTRRKTVVQHPNSGLFLRGLWEEEERSRRQRQMIPDSVHRPTRSKILNRKPIPRSNNVRKRSWIKLRTGGDMSSSPLSSSSSKTSENTPEDSSTSNCAKADSDVAQSQAEQELMLKKKPSPTAAIRSNALSEGYDLNEYKPWRDGTITPHRGCIRSLCQMRSTMLDPWPREESRAKDECTRILHRMREQLNVVINLQIHLRSMIKTSPSHMSFLLSIRHPGQVSVELLSALYGPQFIQTNAFRAIEQLLWGEHRPLRIEHRQHHGHQPQQLQQQRQHSHHQHSGSSLVSSFTYDDDSQTPEYHYHGEDDGHEASFENEDDTAGIQDDHQHYHAQLHYQEHLQEQRYHYHDPQHQMEDDGECKFVEEFGDQSYQDPIMAMGHILDENHHEGQEAKIQDHNDELGSLPQAAAATTIVSHVYRNDREEVNEAKIEELAVSSPTRQQGDGMTVDFVS